MASLSPTYSLLNEKHFAILKPFFTISSVPLSMSSPSKDYPSLKICCSSSGAVPSSSVESPESPSTIIFIKGLALSTSEGHLKKAFSEFGKVSRVKLLTDKKTKEYLGSAFVWFTSEDCAELAVKEMNGKFFDGRFILVTIAKPGACKIPKRATPYKF